MKVLNRKKRNYRLKSLVFHIGDKIETFEFDLNEKLQCTNEERKVKIRKILKCIENDKLQNKKRLETSNDQLFQANEIKTESNNFESTKMIGNECEDVTIDLTNSKIDDLNSKYLKKGAINFSEIKNQNLLFCQNKNEKVNESNVKIDSKIQTKSLYSFSEDLCFSDGDDYLYQNNGDSNFF